MNRIIISFVACVLCCLVSSAQQLPSEFKIQVVNQPVMSFKDTMDLSNPLSASIAMTYMMYHGEKGKWRSVSSRQIWERLSEPDAPRDSVSEKEKLIYLNQNIYQVIIYKDSVATVTSDFGTTGMLRVRNMIKENNRWVNIGEDLQADSEAAYNKFTGMAEKILQEMRDRNKLKILRSDTTRFVDYLHRRSSNPKTYLLEKLGQHKVVIYGELHMRKYSWDFLRTVLADNRFAAETGTIFLELPSHTRNRLDTFLSASELDPEIILDILRQEQKYGWEDRGKYEFILDVWKLNQKLPVNKRIRIIPVDNQLDWSTVVSNDEYKRQVDVFLEARDSHMARTIAEYLRQDSDSRNCLFVVGYNHARKYAAGIPEGAGTAGKQLAEKMPEGQVFSIFTHAPVIGNTGVIFGKLRNGLYDHLFATATGNRPIAFDLKDSPFGEEPFDLFYNFQGTSFYRDHFDGYLFLQPLENEQGAYFLSDLFTNDFVDELKRRAHVTEDKNAWYDMPAETISKEKIIQKLQETQCVGRWIFPTD